MSSEYCRVVVHGLPRQKEDEFTYFCFENGAEGVSEDLSYSQPDVRFHPDVIDSPYFDVNVFFSLRPSEEFFLKLQSEFSGVRASVHIEPNKDWLAEWKKGFKPFLFVEPFWIVPSWCERPMEAKQVLLMDPGMAFGTGTHETTRLAARLLAPQVRQGLSVLDVGTGTGVLAMVAHKLGATPVVAIDNDPEARRVARENLLLNSSEAVAVPESNIEEVQQSYDIVVANIIDGVLLDIRPELLRVLKPGGKLVLSGILSDRATQFFEAFLADGRVKLVERLNDGEWVGALLVSESNPKGV